LTGRGGFMILLLGTLFEGLTCILQCQLLLWSVFYLMPYGWSKFRWRFQSLFGGSFVIDSPQRIIWW